jgi:hypothetical protein
MKYFDFIIMGVISMSSVALAAEDPVDENASQNHFLEKLDIAFTVVFTMEMVSLNFSLVMYNCVIASELA